MAKVNDGRGNRTNHVITPEFEKAINRLETGEKFPEPLSRSPIAIKCPETLTNAIKAMPAKERNVWLRRVLLDAAKDKNMVPMDYGW